MQDRPRQGAVAAVVVTYNRLALLRECLAHLQAQTVSCDVLLVDNASTDGTGDWARGRATQWPGLRYRNTGENIGGAGGFNFGMRWAVEAGYDYVWVMDDDCLPAPDALEKLLEADKALHANYGWLSSQCLWTDGKLCPMNLQRATPYRDIKGFDSALVPAQMASFVSLFLKSKTIRMFGLPIKEFFIWTDDWEFTRRISRHEACYAVRDSKVIHAMKSNTVANIATDSVERLERYRYFYRNDVYLYRREGVKGWIWLLAKDCWHSIETLLVGKMRMKIIWAGVMEGVLFCPDIQYVESDSFD